MKILLLLLMRRIAILGNFILMIVFITDLLSISIEGFPRLINKEVNYVFIIWVGVITSTFSMYYLLYEELTHKS